MTKKLAVGDKVKLRFNNLKPSSRSSLLKQGFNPHAACTVMGIDPIKGGETLRGHAHLQTHAGHEFITPLRNCERLTIDGLPVLGCA